MAIQEPRSARPYQSYVSPQVYVAPAPAWSRWLRRLLVGLVGVAALAAAASLLLALVGGAYRVSAFPAAPTADLGRDAAQPQRLADRALSRIAAAQPRGTWVVVDTYRNRLRVYRDGGLLREALCSTGSGVVLRDPRDGRQWIFDSPMGERRVQRKVRDPIWAKPDWAFIEEGYQPPPAGSRDRYDDFSLGKYGLYMGDGYIIHGTIFQTLLGQRVTHGCIRLGDKDLEFVYREVPLGARVYLY
jgi:L,D-transpeptidase YbiS